MARGSGNERGSESRPGASAGRLAHEVSRLQADLLGKLHDEMPDDDVATFAGAAQRLAEAFGSVTAAAIEPLAPAAAGAPASEAPAASPAPPPAPAGPPKAFPPPAAPALAPVPDEPPKFPQPETHPSLYRHGHMRRRLDQMLEMHRRYEHPFCLAIFDVAGPATRNGDGGPEAALTVVGAALRDGVRLVDEPFRLEEDALCVLAPNQNTVGGVQMSGRLLLVLQELEAAGGLPIDVTAGVVACPEHGTDAGELLHVADEAMWRARSVGQPVGVGRLAGR